MSRIEIILTGTGGQGIQLAGRTQAKAIDNIEHLAALMLDYGAAARGGKSSAYVVIKEYPNDWPEVMKADILIALSQEGFDYWRDRIKNDAMIFFDPVLVKLGERNEDDEKIYYAIPASEIASGLKDARVPNMAMLGGVIAITRLVSMRDITDALREQKKYFENNEKALQRGFTRVRKIESRK
jgi:2-oxoglutarate ferredoxin oxidoreductase subunit gamma